MGSLADTDAMICTTKEFNWSNQEVEILGIKIQNDLVKMWECNFAGIISKADNILNAWSHRGLTIMGKILTINTLVGSLFVYKMQVLAMIPSNVVEQFYEIVKHLLWMEKRPKIPLNVLCKDKESGGLHLVDLVAKHDSLLIQWIARSQTNLFFNEILVNSLLPDLGFKTFLM